MPLRATHLHAVDVAGGPDSDDVSVLIEDLVGDRAVVLAWGGGGGETPSPSPASTSSGGNTFSILVEVQLEQRLCLQGLGGGAQQVTEETAGRAYGYVGRPRQ